MTEMVLRHRAELRLKQRQRILDTAAATFVAKGYHRATVAEIVAGSHVSKTSFYEQFADKEQLFLDLHESYVRTRLAALRTAQRRTAGVTCWRERIREIARICLEEIAGAPAAAALLLDAAAGASAAARSAHERAVGRCVSLIIAINHDLRDASPELAPLSRPLAIAAVSGFREVTRRAADEGPDAVRALIDPMAELWIRLALPA